MAKRGRPRKNPNQNPKKKAISSNEALAEVEENTLGISPEPEQPEKKELPRPPASRAIEVDAQEIENLLIWGFGALSFILKDKRFILPEEKIKKGAEVLKPVLDKYSDTGAGLVPAWAAKYQEEIRAGSFFAGVIIEILRQPKVKPEPEPEPEKETLPEKVTVDIQ